MPFNQAFLPFLPNVLCEIFFNGIHPIQVSIMEKLSNTCFQQEVESNNSIAQSKWRKDERRTDNKILSVLVRNAERKIKAQELTKQNKINIETQ